MKRRDQSDKSSGCATTKDAGGGASPERFLLGLLAATVQPEERQRSLNWQRRTRPSGLEYTARVRHEERALYVTLAEDEAGLPIGLGVEFRKAGSKPSRPGEMVEVVRAYKLDTDNIEQLMAVLLDAVQSQVAAMDQAEGRAAEDWALPIQGQVGAEEAAVLEGYLGMDLNVMMAEALAGADEIETPEDEE